MAQLDLVIRGGTVVDGAGVPRYQADVGIKNGRVARTGLYQRLGMSLEDVLNMEARNQAIAIGEEP